MAVSIALRPVQPEDAAFLYRVYAGTREEELSRLSWDAAQKDAFLRMQFDAQHRYYQKQFPDAAYQVIRVNDCPAGRLYVDRNPDEVRIIDIALLPEYRGQGIGTTLLRSLLEEAGRANKPVRIHVEQANPALRLYRRLGFAVVADRGIYVLMEWSPDGIPEGEDQVKIAS
ncbi:GNAT family N-acetyltransferase [Nitrolancea hollandica]|uniref:Putative Acetyltransferase n=1 Tax=Nitrolancea hollandica Lb TaxID=1129897 RepID=I4EE49_9BACT|nr:GNAT family N-acetyltransferase [Nitrolancea hollandica]CCF82961.1 putative Acetyltransferase [Nitrolancea hollandica Lb]